MAQPTQEEVDNVVAAYDNARASKEYADSIIIEMQQISGDDYNMVWSEAYPS